MGRRGGGQGAGSHDLYVAACCESSPCPARQTQRRSVVVVHAAASAVVADSHTEHCWQLAPAMIEVGESRRSGGPRAPACGPSGSCSAGGTARATPRHPTEQAGGRSKCGAVLALRALRCATAREGEGVVARAAHADAVDRYVAGTLLLDAVVAGTQRARGAGAVRIVATVRSEGDRGLG